MGHNVEDAQASKQTIIINQTSSGNGVGTTGFVFSLLGLFLGWVPVLGWILWLVGFLCSVIGIFRPSRGLAIAGLVLSFAGIIVLMVIGVGIASIFV